MVSLMEALKSLQGIPNQFKASWGMGGFHPDRDLAMLAGARLELDRRLGGRKGPMALDGDQFQEAWAQWKAQGRTKDLPGWMIRVLCNHPASALDPKFQGSLTAHPLLPRRRSWAEGLIAIHFLHWANTPELPSRAESLSRILSCFPEGSPWLLDIRRNNWECLGPTAPEALAQSLKVVLKDLDPLLEQWGISPQQGLGKEVVIAAIRRWADEFRRRRPETVEQDVIAELRLAFETVLSRVPMGQTFLGVVEQVILSEWAKNSQVVRDHLLNWCLAHPNLGDPRHAKSNWHPIPLGRSKLLSWMARRDITFFYDRIVPSAADDQGRKEFWLRYADRMVDFRIASGTYDRSKFKGTSYQKRDIADLDGASDLSAFLMRFEGMNNRPDFICVEFSKSGNALYVYDADVFEERIASMHAIAFRITPGPRNIKDRDSATFRQAHYNNWQGLVRTFLNSRGVSPV